MAHDTHRQNAIDDAIDHLVESMDLGTLVEYATEQLHAWAENADPEELDRLIEEHGQ